MRMIPFSTIAVTRLCDEQMKTSDASIGRYHVAEKS